MAETKRPALGKTVDEYLAALPETHRATLEAVRKAIKAAAPGGTEVISYQIPAYKVNGTGVVWYAAFTNHCSIYPVTDGVKAACEGSTAEFKVVKSTLQFPVDRPLPAALVKKIVRARIAENEEKKASKRKGG